MKTTNELIIKTLITLRSYYSSSKQDIPYGRALQNLFNLNALDTSEIKFSTLSSIVENHITRTTLSSIYYSIKYLFTFDPITIKVEYLTYLIKKLNKKEKYSDFLVYLFGYTIREYIYKDKDNRIHITDINNTCLMSLKDALALQMELEQEEATLIICVSVLKK